MGWGAPTKTWNGQTIFVKAGLLAELRASLPEFDCQPFGIFPAINEDLQQVVRRPITEDPRSIPVGVVSINYQLIQHTQVFDWLRQGLKIAGLSEDLCSTELSLSRYGERMLLWTNLYGLDFDPGDGHPLQAVIVCQNSVDKSCAMEVYLMRVRAVCSNGMIMGDARSIRRMHVQQSKRRMDIANEVARCITWAANEHLVFSQWLKTKVTQKQIEQWADRVVAKKWSTNEAARVAAICRSGFDGDVKREKDKAPSQLQVGWMDQVPGACAPVDNMYHAVQALSWVLSQDPALETRLAKARQVSEMVEELRAAD